MKLIESMENYDIVLAYVFLTKAITDLEFSLEDNDDDKGLSPSIKQIDKACVSMEKYLDSKYPDWIEVSEDLGDKVAKHVDNFY